MKTQIRNLFIALVVLALSTLNSQFSTAFAQGTTAFTYQGQLRDNGTNANGTYTMIFNLYDSLSGGNLIGGPITTTATLANGLFTVNLDFGASAFNGSARYLDIIVTNGGATQELSPRVQVLPSPYALYAAVAATVTNGAIMNAQLADDAVATTNIQNGAITTAQIAAGAVTNTNLTANAVNATNIASGQVVKSFDGLTDAVSLTAGNNIGLFTNSGIVQISSFVPNIQVFHNVTSATFTVPTNVTRIEVEMWGAGGGGGSGYNSGGSSGNIGGGGGGGAYAWNVFTVTPGSSYSVTAPAGSNGGQNGGAASFSGNSISMSADGGYAGGNASSSGNGIGGAGGTASGSIVNTQGGGGDNNGNGGGTWRGASIQLQSAASGGGGPGGGGSGGGPGPPASSGSGGGSGAVIVYY